jgi:hypothetical protein
MTANSLLSYWDENEPADTSRLGLVRLDANEQAIVLFTDQFVSVHLHYCDDPEVRGYVRCNATGGTECVLCKAGRNADEKALLPVYVPAARSVAVLAISPSAKPGSLRPPILAALRSGARSVLLVSKPDRVTHKVASVSLTDDMDDGGDVIAAFREEWDAGEVDLLSLYARHDNEFLAELPAVAAMLKIKAAK